MLESLLLHIVAEGQKVRVKLLVEVLKRAV